MAGLFSDDSFKIGQGVCRYYYKTGRLEKEGNFVDGKKHGLWMGYDENGNTADSSLFSEGMPYLFSYHWNDKNLTLKGIYDSLGKGSGVETTYYNYDSNKISAYGIYSEGYKKQGFWNYYYRSRQKSCREHFVNDSLVSIECYKEDGNLETYNCLEQIMPKAPFNMNQYISENLHFPENFRETYQKDLYARIIVQFVVSETGSIEDIKVIKHTLQPLDNEAVRFVSSMPTWSPGKIHNRPVRMTVKIPVVFVMN